MLSCMLANLTRYVSESTALLHISNACSAVAFRDFPADEEKSTRIEYVLSTDSIARDNWHALQATSPD